MPSNDFLPFAVEKAFEQALVDAERLRSLLITGFLCALIPLLALFLYSKKESPTP